MDTNELPRFLWTDRSVFHRRFEKSASALIAVHKALEKHSELAEVSSAFFSDYQRLTQIDSAEFTRVWKDPYSYWWVRLAYELVGSLLRQEPPTPLVEQFLRARENHDLRGALAEHLSQFGRVVLGASILAREPYRPTRPLEVSLPLAIPGTRLCLSGKGTLTLRELEDGTLIGDHAGKEVRLPVAPSARVASGDVVAESCPLFEMDACQIRLQPHAYQIPGMEFAWPALGEGLEFQARHAPKLHSALSLVEKYAPATFAQFGELIRLMVFKPEEISATAQNNLTHSDLPGSILICPYENPHYLAEVLVHEFHHNRLFCVEEFEILLEDPGIPLEKQAAYASPWKSAPRPMHGILHACYVSLPVCNYWLEVVRSGPRDSLAELARDRLIRGFCQLEIGVYQVARHGKLTAFGRQFLDHLRQEVERLGESIRELGLPSQVPVTACHQDGVVRPVRDPVGERPLLTKELVRDHLTRCGLADQAAELVERFLR